MGLRGPFGVPLPYETLKGRDLLVVGSGVGHAPVRATLVRAIENKPDFGRIAIMASASTYDGLLLKDDLREWAKVPGRRGALLALQAYGSGGCAHRLHQRPAARPRPRLEKHLGDHLRLRPPHQGRRPRPHATRHEALGHLHGPRNQHALRHRQVRALQGREPITCAWTAPCSRTRKGSSFRRSFRHIEEGRGTLSKGVRPSPFPLQPPAVIESLGPIPRQPHTEAVLLVFFQEDKNR